MSRGSSCSTSSNTWTNCSTSDNDSSILAKLRRLKIQEGLLLQNINKIMLKNCNDGEEFITINSDYKSLVLNLRNSYCEVKNLFDSLKCNTTSHEALKTCDIEDVKANVLELEANMKKFKNYLYSEITSLKSEEQEIIKQMNVLTENQIRIIKHPKIRTKLFSDIVPSPVKNIITCPFKCQEVQQFQEFLKSYHRYGGWNEYSHNIFVQFWIKHFGSTTDGYEDIDTSEIIKCNRLVSDIIEKLPGINVEDIIQHSEWYLKYLHLKRCQQEALNKWRAKKKIIKKSQTKDKGIKYTEKKNLSLDFNREKSKNTGRVNFVDEMKGIEEYWSKGSSRCFRASTSDGSMHMRYLGDASRDKLTSEVISKHAKSRGQFHFAKTTQQWINMCNDRRLSNENMSTYIPQLENIKKLCVPKWRLSVKY
ncbi:uncharacterized protein LOC128677865 isoform X3 [Plodia interpunctella]|uniref:uncharacterized protein LOC128677865 isoform X3 n=1 Tax=Plodia interpunctella TaxID=58824 RepID=UPI002368DB96|nr:uncharacterized protein LOC128677865 isoform X3 [Plodia interpunctella]